MKRSGWLKRSNKGLTQRIATQRTRIRRANTARKRREWARAYGSVERVGWITTLPSVASGKWSCVNAHVRNGGAGRKADACWIVPLTDYEHRVELHQMGKPAFEAKYGISLDDCAEATQRAWLARGAA